MRYGTFGWTNTVTGDHYKHVGYEWKPEIIDDRHLTGSLILVALTAGFGSVLFLNLLHSALDLRSGLSAFFLTLFTALLSTISFLLVVICWGVAHHRFHKEGLHPKYGAAFPLVIVGWALYLAAIPLVFIGWVRERHYRRAGAQTGDTPMTMTT